MMDLGDAGGGSQFGAPTSEPTVSFGAASDPAAAGGGLDSLSLDSLTLDEESTKVLPPPDFPATRRGPLDRPPAAPAPGPGISGGPVERGRGAGAVPRRAPGPAPGRRAGVRRRKVRARRRRPPEAGRRGPRARRPRGGDRDLVPHLPDRHQQRRGRDAHRKGAAGHGRGQQAAHRPAPGGPRGLRGRRPRPRADGFPPGARDRIGGNDGAWIPRSDRAGDGRPGARDRSVPRARLRVRRRTSKRPRRRLRRARSRGGPACRSIRESSGSPPRSS